MVLGPHNVGPVAYRLLHLPTMLVFRHTASVKEFDWDACCRPSRTAHRPLLAAAADKALYARLTSILSVAAAFIFAHESAVIDISRCHRHVCVFHICAPEAG